MKIRKEEKSEIKMEDNIRLNGSQEFSDRVYFNQTHFASDTQWELKEGLKGELQGSVYYVQNSVIPSHNHIPDDVQPGIVANRKMMVLFNPDDDGLKNIYLNIRGEKNRIILTKTLVHNDSGIPLCLQASENINFDFSIPKIFDVTIDKNKELKEISDDVNAFDAIISKHDTIKIRTSDGNYSSTFTLNSNRSFSGKKIYFVCDSGYRVALIRPGLKTLSLGRGESFLFFNYNDQWLIEGDLNYQFIKYMKNCWHASIPAEAVKPDMTLEFFTENKKGIIDDIYVGAPNQLLLHTISIGMLTPYREGFDFQANPEYHRQYFQQIPVSQLIVSTYDPIYLKEVMLPDGRLFTDFAPDEGGTYTGSMREDIGKDLISQGINYANYGYTSSKIHDDSKKMIAAQITIHTSVGKYKNGIQIHGLSGGAGMVTLNNTIGNEFSHELGHNYGLGHYPGGVYGSVAQISSVRNSAWGWDSDNHFFIPNFEQTVTNKATYLDKDANDPRPTAPFEGHSLGKDAMAGGEPFYPKANAFTLHTPYVLSAIQKFFESKAMFNQASPTGFSIWNTKTKKIEPYRLINTDIYFTQLTVRNSVDITADELNGYLKNKINVFIQTWDGSHARNVNLPNADQNNNGAIVKLEIDSSFYVNVMVNGKIDELHKGTIRSYISNGNYWEVTDSESTSIAPYKQGVNVITLVGFYDPEGKLTSYIYPALNGSYGNVYNFSMKSQNYLEIECSSGQKISYPLASSRFISNRMNKFHVNVERDLIPDTVRLYLNGKIVAQRKIILGSDNLSYTVNGVPLS